MSSAAAVIDNCEHNLSRKPQRVESSPIVLVSVVALLFFGPLSFGAVEPWSILVLESAACSLTVLWMLQQIRAGELRIAGSRLFSPMVAFAALIGLQIAFGKTSNRLDTLSTGALYIAYGTLCFLLVQTLTRASQIQKLTVAISCYGVALAGFALLQGLAPNGKLYWLRTPRFGGWIYGPYVNHNHYAGLMEMLWPFPLMFALSSHGTRRNRVLGATAAAIMATSIFLSGSRGGMVAFAVQVILLCLLQFRRWEKRPQTVGIAVATLVVALMAGIGGRELAARLITIPNETRTELSGGTRINIDRDALHMFTEKPFVGWGLGTFADVYPQFRSFPTNLVLDKAHNDYLQLLVEMGSVGFLVMGWFLCVLARAAASNLKHQHSAKRNIAVAAILGITGVLIHSFVDFNLQIPANAAWFYVLCTLAAMDLSRLEPENAGS